MAEAAYRSPLIYRVHGAVEAVGPDAGTAAHYGDPVQEQRALARGSAVVDLSHKGVLAISGEDRLSWLTTLSSQALGTVVPGDSAETLFLTVQGRVEFAPHVFDDGARTWLITEIAETEGLRQWLESMRFALRVEVEDHTSKIAVVGAVQVPEHVEAAALRLAASLTSRVDAEADPAAVLPLCWEDPWPGIATGGWGYAVHHGHPGEDYSWSEVLVAREDLVSVLTGPEADGLQLAGSWAGEALRIEAWRPRWATEVDERTVPHELDWLRTAVHLEKGCYKGQETVARVHNLGHPPRRLTFLDVDGSEHTIPPVGSEVVVGERVVGKVTSAQLHHEAGPIALAVLKRSVDPSAALLVRAPALPVPPADSEAEEPSRTAGPTAETTTDAADGTHADGAAAPENREQWAAAQTVVVPPDAGQTVQREKGFLRGPR